MSITRRLFLRASAAVGAVGITSAGPAVSAKPDIQTFLDTASPCELAWYHACQLADAMGRMDKSRAYVASVDVHRSFAMVVGHPVNGKRAPVAKVWIDDGLPLLADDVVRSAA